MQKVAALYHQRFNNQKWLHYTTDVEVRTKTAALYRSFPQTLLFGSRAVWPVSSSDGLITFLGDAVKLLGA